MHRQLQFRCVFSLLLAFLIALGCKRGAEPGAPEAAPGEENHVGPFTTEKTPDGQPLVVTFPGKPEWADVPDFQPVTKGFVWRGDGKRGPYSAWVWTIPADERARNSDQELGHEYAKRAAYAGFNGTYLQYGTDPRGAGFGSWQSRPFEPGGERWARPDSGAGFVLIVGDKAYCLRIVGSELAVSDPDCKAFFDSLQLPELKNRPPTTQAPEDDLRPFARDGYFHNGAGIGTHSTGIGFCLGRNTVFRATYAHSNFQEDPSTARLKRYKYPTFQPDGEYKLPGITSIIASDDKRNRLYLLIGAQFRTPAKLARFDVPESLGAGKEEEAKGLMTADIPGTVAGVCVTWDGEHLFVIHEWDRRQNAELLRFETQGMTRTHTLPLPRATTSLCQSPDGKTLYAAFDTGLEKVGPDHGGGWMSNDCRIQEIDVATLKVRRTFSTRASAGALTCGADGRLYLLASEGRGWVRVDPTIPGEPKIQQVANNDGYNRFLLSPDAKRFYVLQDGRYPYSLDVKELFDYGRFVIAPEYMKTHHARTFGPDGLEPMRGSVALIGGGIVSPDGKCLFLNSGNAFWLTGAGPLPEVDPAMKWNPMREPPKGARPPGGPSKK